MGKGWDGWRAPRRGRLRAGRAPRRSPVPPLVIFVFVSNLRRRRRRARRRWGRGRTGRASHRRSPVPLLVVFVFVSNLCRGRKGARRRWGRGGTGGELLGEGGGKRDVHPATRSPLVVFVWALACTGGGGGCNGNGEGTGGHESSSASGTRIPPLAHRLSSSSGLQPAPEEEVGATAMRKGQEGMRAPRQGQRRAGRPSRSLLVPPLARRSSSLSSSPACAGGDRGNDGDGEGAEREESSSVRAAASGMRIPPLAGPTTRQYGRSLAAHPARLRLSSVHRRRRARQRMGKGCGSYEDDRKVNGEEMIIILQNFSGTKWISRIVVAFF